MQENKETTTDKQRDEDLFDTLIAISVVAKRLAKKLQEGGEPDEQEERTGCPDF